MSIGDFSSSNDPEDPAFHCTPGRIPIVPVRFSLQPYELNSVRKPTSFTQPNSYIIREIRRGFVYIFIEAAESDNPSTSDDGTWYVFRHMTSSNDANADEAPEGTTIDDVGSGYFMKYEWEGHLGAGDWTYSGEKHKECWVPPSASKVWIAYSEFRWPPVFFGEGYKQSFREKMMTPINLRGTNNWAGYMAEAAELVEEWKSPENRNPVDLVRLAWSQTGFSPRPSSTWTFPITPDNADCVAVVGVMDPLGDIAEMQYRLEVTDDHQKSFEASYIYPLTIGRFCDKLEPSLDPRDGFWDSLPWANGPALKPGWKMSFMGLDDISRQNRRALRQVVTAIKRQINDSGNQMLGMHLDLAKAEGDKGDTEAIEYYTIVAGRALTALSITTDGSAAIRQALGSSIQSPGPGIEKTLNGFKSLWDQMAGAGFNNRIKAQYAFKIAFEAIAVELGTEVASRPSILSGWQRAVEAGHVPNANGRLLLSTQTMTLDAAIDFMTGTNGPYNVAGTAGNIAENSTLNVRQLVDAGPGADIPFIETSVTGAAVPAGGIDRSGRIAMGEFAFAGLGLFLSTWALINTAKAQAEVDGLFARGDVTRFTTSRGFQLATAALGVAEALHATVTAGRTVARASQVISNRALTILYEGAVSGGNLARVGVVQPAAGAIGRATGKLATRITLCLGWAVAIGGTISGAGTAIRGVEREDTAQIASGVCMVVGSLLLIPGLGWGAALVGAAILAIGFLISLGQYTPLEDVVRVGFWGSSSTFPGQTPRAGFSALIGASKDLPGRYEGYFKDEVARFSELTWSPIITDPRPGDRKVLISSQALADGSIGSLTVNAMYEVPGRIYGTNEVPISARIVPVPGRPEVRVDLGRYQGNKVVVVARIVGPRTGYSHETIQEFTRP